MDSFTSRLCTLSAFLLALAAWSEFAQAGDPGQSALLYFTTPGCSWCQVVAPTVTELQQEGLPVVKVDGSVHPEIARKFQVKGYPTFVLVVDGQEQQRVEGAKSKPVLEGMARTALKARQEAVASNAAPPQSQHTPALTSRNQVIASQASGFERASLGPAGDFPGHVLPSSSPLEQRPPVDRELDQVRVASNDVPRQPFPAAASALPAERNWSLFDRDENSRQPEVRSQPAVYRGNNEPLDSTAAISAETALPGSKAAVRIRVKDNGGENFGTGTVLEYRYGRSVILTCGHVLRDLSPKSVVEVDVFVNGQIKTHVAEVIDADLKADVGLIAIPAEQQLPVAIVAQSDKFITVGSEVCSIGCSAGANPSSEMVKITALNRYVGPDNIECTGLPVPGRSGGGLFDKHQQIIGVCIAADRDDKRGLYCGLKPIHEILRKNRLGHLVGDAHSQEESIAFGDSPVLASASNSPSPLETLDLAPQARSAAQSGVSPAANAWDAALLTQSPAADASLPTSASLAQASATPSTLPPSALAQPALGRSGISPQASARNLDDATRATLSTAKGSKLTILIESPDGGQPQVVVIPSVSASFLAELTGASAEQGPSKAAPKALQITSGRLEGGELLTAQVIRTPGSCHPVIARSATPSSPLASTPLVQTAAAPSIATHSSQQPFVRTPAQAAPSQTLAKPELIPLEGLPELRNTTPDSSAITSPWEQPAPERTPVSSAFPWGGANSSETEMLVKKPRPEQTGFRVQPYQRTR